VAAASPASWPALYLRAWPSLAGALPRPRIALAGFWAAGWVSACSSTGPRVPPVAWLLGRLLWSCAGRRLHYPRPERRSRRSFSVTATPVFLGLLWRHWCDSARWPGWPASRTRVCLIVDWWHLDASCAIARWVGAPALFAPQGPGLQPRGQPPPFCLCRPVWHPLARRAGPAVLTAVPRRFAAALWLASPRWPA